MSTDGLDKTLPLGGGRRRDERQHEVDRVGGGFPTADRGDGLVVDADQPGDRPIRPVRVVGQFGADQLPPLLLGQMPAGSVTAQRVGPLAGLVEPGGRDGQVVDAQLGAGAGPVVAIEDRAGLVDDGWCAGS